MLKSAFIAATLLAAAGSAHAGDVTVTLSGVQARGGALLVALQTRDQFMQHRGAYGERIMNPPAGTATVTFHDVAPGDYSLSVLHDENGDDRMQTSAGGIPTEGWAMHNGATLRGAPTFDQVKVTVPASGLTLSESMTYWDGQAPGRH